MLNTSLVLQVYKKQNISLLNYQDCPLPVAGLQVCYSYENINLTFRNCSTNHPEQPQIMTSFMRF